LIIKHSLCTALALSGALACAAGTAVAAPQEATSARALISRFDDGSFEYPLAQPNWFTNYTAGQAIGPWRVTKGSVEVIDDGYWQPAEGDQSIDLNGEDVGAVSQTFTTIPGQNYTLTYQLAGNPVGTAWKTGRVLIDGRNVQNFAFNVTGKSFTNMGWTRQQVTFQATNSTTTLTFDSTTADPAFGPAIDDVQVTATCCSCSPAC
jgi:choice-of-anchor C domain-containing protein